MTDSEELKAKRRGSNARFIEKLRSNSEVPYPALVLHHTGRKSGETHITPAAHLIASGNRYVLFAANWGSPTDPDWCQNLRVNPETIIEVGADTINVTAREAEGLEREELIQMILSDPILGEHRAEFERASGRQIPVIVLTPRTEVNDAP